MLPPILKNGGLPIALTFSAATCGAIELAPTELTLGPAPDAKGDATVVVLLAILLLGGTAVDGTDIVTISYAQMHEYAILITINITKYSLLPQIRKIYEFFL
jgi:hypothetical protein